MQGSIDLVVMWWYAEECKSQDIAVAVPPGTARIETYEVSDTGTWELVAVPPGTARIETHAAAADGVHPHGRGPSRDSAD